VFVRDRDVSNDKVFDEPGDVATVRVSENATTGMGADAGSTGVAMSADGRFVTFTSGASNLAGDTNFSCDANGDTIAVENCPQVFVRDRDADGDGTFDETGEVSMVKASLSTGGVEGDRQSNGPVLSSTGRYVAFESFATNLVEDDTNENCNGASPNCRDIFVRDLQANATVRVSLSGSGDQGDAASGKPSVSADGRFVAIQSRASNLAGT
jgi:hypothetical protein